MADIELVIKIPEEMWKKIKEGYVPVLGISKYLKNGTPLPKGHGKIIDGDKVLALALEEGAYGYVSAEEIANTQAIIEADKENKNEKL